MQIEKKSGKEFSKKISAENLFVENCNYSRQALKRHLHQFLNLEYICNICKLKPFWNNKKLTLQIDHINGVHNDNRLENLRWLCPNCHSQTDSFAGRNLKKDKIKYNCLDCNKTITKYGIRCRSCSNSKKMKMAKNKKIEWPSNEEISKLVWEIPRSQLAKQLGVSDKAISNYCKRREIEQPPRGYWNSKRKNK